MTPIRAGNAASQHLEIAPWMETTFCADEKSFLKQRGGRPLSAQPHSCGGQKLSSVPCGQKDLRDPCINAKDRYDLKMQHNPGGRSLYWGRGPSGSWWPRPLLQARNPCTFLGGDPLGSAPCVHWGHLRCLGWHQATERESLRQPVQTCSGPLNLPALHGACGAARSAATG